MGYFDAMAESIAKKNAVEVTVKCSTCKGTGQVPVHQWYSIVGHKECPSCKGSGTFTYTDYR